MNRFLRIALIGLSALALGGCGASADGGSGKVFEGSDVAVSVSLDQSSALPGTNLVMTADISSTGTDTADSVRVEFDGSGWDVVITEESLPLLYDCTADGGECGDIRLEDESLVADVSVDAGGAITYVARLPLAYSSDSGADSISIEVCADLAADTDPDNNCGSAEASVGDAPEIVDFRDETIYWALTDRFLNGDTSNDDADGTRPRDAATDPANPFSWHGGDYAGIKQKIEEGYFQQMGFTTIWISPVVRQNEGFDESNGLANVPYHGYWLENYDDNEPHFGTWANLKELVDAAHANDMKIIIDFVANHTGNNVSILQTEPDWFRVEPSCTEGLDIACVLAGAPPPADPLDSGSALPDTRQEVPEARQWVLDGARNVLLQSGADGFRLDVYKHVNPDFWYDFFAPGGPGDRSTVFSVGESFDNAETIASDLNDDGAPSMFDFPLQAAINETFAKRGGTAVLATTFENDALYDDPTRLTTFIDNHDVHRFTSEALNAGATLTEAEERLSMALGFLYGARGIPMVYYGTETAMRGWNPPDNRRDMIFPAATSGLTGLARAQVTCGVTGSGDPSEAYGEPIFLRGDFNGWVNPPPGETQFQNMGGDVYEVQLEFGAGLLNGFKIMSEDFVAVDFTAATEIGLDDPTTLGPFLVPTTIILPRSGCYSFTLDVSDPVAPVLTVSEVTDGPPPKETCGVTGIGDPGDAYGDPVFARGGFNDWGTPPEAMFMNMGGNDYQAEFEIDPGAYDFKVAKEDWSTEFTADGPVDLDVPVTLIDGAGAGNSAIDLENAGCYNFDLDVTDPLAPVLTVKEVPVLSPPEEGVDLVQRIADLAAARGGYEALRRGTQTVVYAPAGACEPQESGNDPTEAFGVEMFARGSFNGWADPPPATDAFANLGEGIYEARVTLGVGDQNYKVAAGDWSTEWAVIAADSGNTPLDTEVTLVPASGAGTEGVIAVTESGCYGWTMDANDTSAPTLTVSLLGTGLPTDVFSIQRDLDGAASVVVIVNNEDDDIDLGALGNGGIPVDLADGAVSEITGAETDLAVAGGLLQGTIPARTSYLVSDQ